MAIEPPTRALPTNGAVLSDGLHQGDQPSEPPASCNDFNLANHNFRSPPPQTPTTIQVRSASPQHEMTYGKRKPEGIPMSLGPRFPKRPALGTRSEDSQWDSLRSSDEIPHGHNGQPRQPPGHPLRAEHVVVAQHDEEEHLELQYAQQATIDLVNLDQDLEKVMQDVQDLKNLVAVLKNNFVGLFAEQFDPFKMLVDEQLELHTRSISQHAELITALQQDVSNAQETCPTARGSPSQVLSMHGIVQTACEAPCERLSMYISTLEKRIVVQEKDIADQRRIATTLKKMVAGLQAEVAQMRAEVLSMRRRDRDMEILKEKVDFVQNENTHLRENIDRTLGEYVHASSNQMTELREQLKRLAPLEPLALWAETNPAGLMTAGINNQFAVIGGNDVSVHGAMPGNGPLGEGSISASIAQTVNSQRLHPSTEPRFSVPSGDHDVAAVRPSVRSARGYPNNNDHDDDSDDEDDSSSTLSPFPSDISELDSSDKDFLPTDQQGAHQSLSHSSSRQSEAAQDLYDTDVVRILGGIEAVHALQFGTRVRGPTKR